VRRAEQLRSELKCLSVQHRGRHLGTVTISIRVASYPANGTVIGDLISAADGALYLAKAGGRDRVIAAGVLPTTGEIKYHGSQELLTADVRENELRIRERKPVSGSE